MKIIEMKTDKTNSRIHIAPGLLKTAGELINSFTEVKRTIIVSDENVYRIYGKVLEQSLSLAGMEYKSIVMPAGEKTKDRAGLNRLYNEFHQFGLDRSNTVTALGGGVIGDLAGYAAATYMRGIPIIQIPTSLLAQVDSSVGGKTAIDMPFGKNAVGAFHQPSAVIVDPELINTLRPEFYSDGMAEVIKYGCIKDRSIIDDLLTNKPDIDVISRCIEIKVDIVRKDEFDTGERMLLNFGHTIGHAIEKCQNYSGNSHGEAVAIGMVAAVRLGEKMNITSAGTAEELLKVLNKYNLPVSIGIDGKEIIAAVLSDKKKRGGEISFVLLKKIGESLIRKLTIEEIGGNLFGFNMG